MTDLSRKFTEKDVRQRDKREEQMKSRHLNWRMYAILLPILAMAAEVCGKRPEIILEEVLAKPFAPREVASPKCIRDSEIYLEALEKYTPWAIKSE